MLRTLQAILIVAAVCSATLAVAHPVHYAIAAAGTKPVSETLPDKVYSAVAGDTGAARAEALAQCRNATIRTCVVIGSGAATHSHK